MTIHESEKAPRIFIPSYRPIFLEGLEIFAHEVKLDVIPGKFEPEIIDILQQNSIGLIRISINHVVILISEKTIPRSIDKIKNLQVELEKLIEYFDNSILIFQKYEETLKKFEKISPKSALAIRGLFIRFYLANKIGVLPTRHLKDTILCLRSLAKRIQIKDNDPSIARIKPKITTLFDAQKFFLEGLIDIGEKRTFTLVKNFSSPKEVIEQILKSEIKFTKSGNPKGISGIFANISGFNHEFIIKNQELLQKKL